MAATSSLSGNKDQARYRLNMRDYSQTEYQNKGRNRHVVAYYEECTGKVLSRKQKSLAVFDGEAVFHCLESERPASCEPSELPPLTGTTRKECTIINLIRCCDPEFLRNQAMPYVTALITRLPDEGRKEGDLFRAVRGLDVLLAPFRKVHNPRRQVEPLAQREIAFYLAFAALLNVFDGPSKFRQTLRDNGFQLAETFDAEKLSIAESVFIQRQNFMPPVTPHQLLPSFHKLVQLSLEHNDDFHKAFDLAVNCIATSHPFLTEHFMVLQVFAAAVEMAGRVALLENRLDWECIRAAVCKMTGVDVTDKNFLPRVTMCKLVGRMEEQMLMVARIGICTAHSTL